MLCIASRELQSSQNITLNILEEIKVVKCYELHLENCEALKILLQIY